MLTSAALNEVVVVVVDAAGYEREDRPRDRNAVIPYMTQNNFHHWVLIPGHTITIRLRTRQGEFSETYVIRTSNSLFRI